MAQKDFDAFTAELRDFPKLWASGTLSCVAVGSDRLFINLGTRIVLNPEPQTEQTVLRFVDLTGFNPPLFGSVTQYSISDIDQLIYQVVATGRFQLMINGFPCWVDASGRANNQTGDNTPAYPWLPPSSRVRSVAREEWSIDRPMRVLIQTGLPTYGRVSPHQIEKLNAQLKAYKPAPFAGVVGLIRELMPGAPADPLQGFVQIAAPLPFDLSYDTANGLSVEAPAYSFKNGIVLSAFYKPSGSERQDLSLANSVPLREGHFRRWEGDLNWPNGAETANVVLLYNDNEVDTLVGVTRRPRALKADGTATSVQWTDVEAAVDSRADWEQIGEPLGEGGQSRVLLVRRTTRSRARAIAIRQIRETNPWHIATKEDAAEKAGQFAEAVWTYARPDVPTELGAMKIFDKLHSAGDDGEREALDRLKSEITVLRQRRTGLPELLSANEAERWIVTEFFPLGTLEHHLDIYKGKPAFALEAFRTLLKTLAPLHDEKIVHRDIKPANVFVREPGELVLGDFGIVYLPNQADRQTLTNERVGPRDYMPPWADRDRRMERVEPNFDVYMLGKLLWCMVAGRLKLFREEHHSPEFDLTAMFPNDPDMYVINSILDLCIVLKPDDCRQSARALLPAIEEALGILNRGGQLLSEGVPRPCRVCGKGFYRPGGVGSSLDREIKLRAWRGQEPVMLTPFRVFTCDSCGHVETFVPRGPS